MEIYPVLLFSERVLSYQLYIIKMVLRDQKEYAKMYKLCGSINTPKRFKMELFNELYKIIFKTFTGCKTEKQNIILNELLTIL